MNLTRLSFVLLALICLVGIAEQWTTAASLPLWRLVAALLVLGLGYEWLQIRRACLSVSIDEPLRLRLGRKEALLLHFNNSDQRDYRVEFAPGLPAGLGVMSKPEMLQLPAGSSTDACVQTQATELGGQPWPHVYSRIRGALGLGWWPRRLPLHASIDVVPDSLSVAGSSSGVLVAGDRSARVGSGPELHHLREYVAGDPRHTVDWKATARAQQLITRVLSEEQHLEIMLVLDVGRTSRTEIDGLSQFNHYINLIARFAQHAIASGDKVGLIAAADKPQVVIPPQRGDIAVMRIRQAMQGLQAMPVETDLLAAARRVQQVARQRCLVILLTDLYGHSLSGDFGRSLKVWNLRHLPLVVGLIGEDVRNIPGQTAHNRTDPYISLAGLEYRNILQGNAIGAQRLGARAIVARPAELQARIFAEYQMLKRQHRV